MRLFFKYALRVLDKVGDEPLIEVGEDLQERPGRLKEQVEAVGVALGKGRRFKRHSEELVGLDHEVVATISDAGYLRVVPGRKDVAEAEVCGV